MNLVTVRYLDFLSFAKLLVLVAASFGFIFGVLTLGFALTGGRATCTIIVLQFTGVTAGLINLVWAPVLCGAFACIASPILFLPVRTYLKLNGLVLRGHFDSATEV